MSSEDSSNSGTTRALFLQALNGTPRQFSLALLKLLRGMMVRISPATHQLLHLGITPVPGSLALFAGHRSDVRFAAFNRRLKESTKKLVCSHSISSQPGIHPKEVRSMTIRTLGFLFHLQLAPRNPPSNWNIAVTGECQVKSALVSGFPAGESAVYGTAIRL